MSDNINELITIEELCDVLSIGRNAAYTLLKKGKVKAFRIGRVWKIPKKAINEFICSESQIKNI